MRDVHNTEIENYWKLCESLARPFVGQHQAEQDDLVQEGLIHVWDRLGRDLPINTDFIRNRMRDWVRFCERLARGDSIEYERAMATDPLEYVTI